VQSSVCAIRRRELKVVRAIRTTLIVSVPATKLAGATESALSKYASDGHGKFTFGAAWLRICFPRFNKSGRANQSVPLRTNDRNSPKMSGLDS
jgi:hypothetical protein